MEDGDDRAALRRLAIGYAPANCRDGLAALFALDATLGNILRTTREAIVGRMRLAWWREALERLDTAPAPAEPVLQALAEHVLGRHGVTGARLSVQAEAWEWLLEAPLDRAAIRHHAALRGDLFGVAGKLCGGSADARAVRAGRGWAFADLAGNLGDQALVDDARARARRWLGLAARGRWPRDLRALGALALIARSDLSGGGGAGIVPRLAWHRLTGR